MKLPQLSLRDLFWLVALVAALGVGVVVGGHFIPRSASYAVAADFDQLPESDEQLLNWLRSQPGVVEHTVRVKRSGGRLDVGFIPVQNLFGQPAFPNLESKAKALGYGPETARFQDVPR